MISTEVLTLSVVTEYCNPLCMCLGLMSILLFLTLYVDFVSHYFETVTVVAINCFVVADYSCLPLLLSMLLLL